MVSRTENKNGKEVRWSQSTPAKISRLVILFVFYGFVRTKLKRLNHRSPRPEHWPGTASCSGYLVAEVPGGHVLYYGGSLEGRAVSAALEGTALLRGI
jgi:hypothetical protein